MLKRIMPIIQTVVVAVLIFSLSLTCFFKAPAEYSETERRPLEQLPEVSFDSVASGKFMAGFEGYTTDQFPMRDMFRKLKAFSSMYVFNESDNNGYYIKDGSVSRTEYPLDPVDLDHAVERFSWIHDRYLNDDNRVYVSVIPDKNAFAAGDSAYLTLDYEALYAHIKNGTADFAEYIDISDLLTLSDYYNTDTHWRQEKIVDVAKALANAMGTDIPDEYTEETLDNPFYGVHFKQSAMPFLTPDTVRYLTNDTISGFEVFDLQNQKPMAVYDMEKANGSDPYEMFLSGSLSLITINNPNAATDKELVIFRDSFGSSITPLLAQGYAKVTVVDIRYIISMTLGNFVDFENADVLFLYSSLVLNSSKDTIK